MILPILEVSCTTWSCIIPEIFGGFSMGNTILAGLFFLLIIGLFAFFGRFSKSVVFFLLLLGLGVLAVGEIGKAIEFRAIYIGVFAVIVVLIYFAFMRLARINQPGS